MLQTSGGMSVRQTRKSKLAAAVFFKRVVCGQNARDSNVAVTKASPAAPQNETSATETKAPVQVNKAPVQVNKAPVQVNNAPVQVNKRTYPPVFAPRNIVIFVNYAP